MSDDVVGMFSIEPIPFMFDAVEAFDIFVVDDLVVVVVMSDVVAVVGDCDVAVLAVLVPGSLGGRLEPGRCAVHGSCWNIDH